MERRQPDYNRKRAVKRPMLTGTPLCAILREAQSSSSFPAKATCRCKIMRPNVLVGLVYGAGRISSSITIIQDVNGCDLCG